MLTQTSIAQLLINFAVGFVLLGIQIAAVVGAVVAWQHTKPRIGRAALVATSILLLGIPSNVIALVYLNPGAFGVGFSAQWAPFFTAIVGAITLFQLVLGFGAVLAQVPIAVLADPQTQPFPCLFRDVRFEGWLLGAVCGVVVAVGSVLLFELLGISESDLVARFLQMMPGLDPEAPWFLLGVALPTFVSAAIAEEVLFRGVVQRWLTRWFGSTARAAWAAIALTSALWAVAHVANADAPFVKIAQTFIIGLGLGWLAYRRSVEAAMVGHVALNVTVVGWSLLR